ncbi:MAG: CpsB/CapC family capsule biosynthesis tyrosine phosphatase [bacterium]|nr:CpsB/CapC family capsule biosynthesis tyrosine phosphatase [bacterium]
MIDIHAHILPGIDDGPETLDEAIEIANKAFKAGTKAIVATPHTLNGLYRNDRNKVLGEVVNFRQTLKERDIPLDVLPGADIALTPELIPCLDAGELMTINDGRKYLLVELQPYYFPEKIHKIIFALKTRGITPIITHPERDALIMKNNEILAGFIERGCLSQITAMSLTGGFGNKIKMLSAELIKSGMIHIIASDCHSADKRPPSLKGAVDVAAELIGLTKAMKMVQDIPAAVMKGEGVDIPSPLIVNKKWGWPWSRFFAG